MSERRECEVLEVITNEYEISRLFKMWVDKTFATQKEAANAMEMSEQYLSDILRERRPVPHHLVCHTGFQPAWVRIRQIENEGNK